MKNKTIIILGVIGLLIIFYGLVIVPQNMQKRKLEAEEKIRFDKALKYMGCESDAYNSYDMSWENNCAILKKEANCGLPTYISNPLNETLKDNKDRCVALYK